MIEKKDWKKWHTHYDNSESGLAKRLRLVQNAISTCLPEQLDTKYQIVDICAGDGRDLLAVLQQYPHIAYVHSYLIEIDERLVEKARAEVKEYALKNIEVAQGDASLISAYKNVTPANLILLCGVFGNINNDAIENTIANLSQLSVNGTRIIWTRNLRSPNMTPKIRELFLKNDFREISFDVTQDASYGVGIHEYIGQTKNLSETMKLFEFIK